LIHANSSIPTTPGRVLSRGQAHHDVASRLRVVGRLRAFLAPFVSCVWGVFAETEYHRAYCRPYITSGTTTALG